MIVPAYHAAVGLRAGRYSVVIDPRTNHIATDVLFMPPADVAKHMLENGATCVVKFRVDRASIRNYVPRGILTCVSMVKAVCAISDWHVWTPKHLARWLAMNGGEVIAGGDQHGENVRPK